MDVFEQFCTNIKRGSNGEYLASCPNPNHNDSNPSFSYEPVSGKFFCHGCGWSGNHRGSLVILLEREGLITDRYAFMDSEYKPRKPMIKKTYKINRVALETKMEQYIQNLENNMDRYPKYWKTELIREIGIGLKDDLTTRAYAYKNESGEIVGIKYHKTHTLKDGESKCYQDKDGDCSSKWFPMHLMAKYTTDKPLHHTEGEGDCITLISNNIQSTCFSTGARSIPKDENGEPDVKFFGRWLDHSSSESPVWLDYDNDKAGDDGGNKLKKTILNPFPYLDVRIFKWKKDRPKGYDISDAFSNNEQQEHFYDALIPKFETKIGGLELITGVEAFDCEVEDVHQIVEGIVPEGIKMLLGGTAKGNKSYMSMQLGMSIANGEEHFLEFKIDNSKQYSVLYIDTEVGKNELIRRYQRILKNFKWNASSKFNMVSVYNKVDDYYKIIPQYIQQLKPDIVFVDCLYNTTEGNISKNSELAPTLDKIDTIIRRFKPITFIAVHHFNKGQNDMGLDPDRFNGGGRLKAWAELMVMISKTNNPSIRVFKVDNSRVIEPPGAVYQLEWDSDKFLLKNEGVCNDWKSLLVSEEKKYKWDSALDEMADEFETGEFKSYCYHTLKIAPRTSLGWLKEMTNFKVIEKIRHGIYKKKLKLVEAPEEPKIKKNDN